MSFKKSTAILFFILLSTFSFAMSSCMPNMISNGLNDFYNLRGSADSDGDGFEDDVESSLGTNQSDKWSYPKPDLLVADYSLSGNIIKVDIENKGIWSATSIIILIEIESLSLELFNNSESPIFLDVNEEYEVILDLSDFDLFLLNSQEYIVSITVDPENWINETNDDNNKLYIFNVVYGAQTSTPPNILLPVIIIVIVVGIVSIASFMALKLIKRRNKQKASDNLYLSPYSSESTIQESLEGSESISSEIDPHKIAPNAHKKIKETDLKESMSNILSSTTSEEESKALEKTEEEMIIEKSQFTCIVHRGAIFGTVYICPHCQSVYCQKCAKTLRDEGEKCWSCKNDITLDLIG